MSDVLISKDEAVDTVRKMCQMILDKCDTHYDEYLKDEVYDNTLEVDAVLRCNKYISIALNNLPSRSASEERKHGKWIPWKSPEGYITGTWCSECEYVSSAMPGNGTAYCPSCGAKMEDGEQDV